MSEPVVTRFAPSPTGFLHIGGGRTALFNWLFARHHGGKMLLRIEDTDRERSTKAAIDAIIDGLSWLGLSWDGDIVYQFSRAARHRAVAEQLLAEGKAYRCYASPEELAAMREAARKEGRSKLYDGRWRDRDPSEAPAGVKPVIRLKAPQAGETVIEDQVQGRVTWQNADLDDLVLLRSDGTPTYMLAVVVDDHDMAVTHIIRGDDHLTNGARQKHIYDALGWSVPVMAHIPLIHGPDGSKLSKRHGALGVDAYRAMGWEVPVMAHIPLIHGADGAKLSKRHGALGVDAYRAMGYLPEAVRNYLVRLGWSHGDDEIMTTEQLIAWFDVDGIGKSSARFDVAKLESLNAHYIRTMPDEQLFDTLVAALPHLPGGNEFLARLTPEKRRRLLAAMPGLKDRAKTLIDLTSRAGFLLADRPLSLDA
ncbi:MAG TPA: glutamate--tRNA ligase, partial [Pseudolabrys sp.]|nr:glutamate--tRNA ligase [Pseudolabrys sp.]